MVLKHILLSLFCLAGIICCAQEANYAVTNIPDRLKNNAHAVIRLRETNYTITSPREHKVVEKIAITILDEKGKDNSVFRGFYSSRNEFTKVEGTLYDKDGQVVKMLKKKDIKQFAGIGSSFVDEYKELYFSFETSQYPYTVEYTTEEYVYTAFFIDPWRPVGGYHLSAEKAVLSVEFPSDFPLRWRAVKLPSQPQLTNLADKQVLSLSLTNLAAKSKGDEFTPLDDLEMPSLIFAADTFVFYDSTGGAKTWNALGNFIYKINANRDQLTPTVKATVHKLTDTCTSDLSKINVLYHYLQQNTRYVNISLGIGGWQTFNAEFVSEKKYGDCKALTNFMKSLLKEVGITGYATYVYAGAQPLLKMDDDFPHSVFNHVILCVPRGRDTTWLECTSQSLPVGYLSDFTDDRKVLLTNQAGGFVIKTPAYRTETNILIRKAELNLNERDELAGLVTLTYKGSFWNSENKATAEQPAGTLNKYLGNVLGFPDYTVSKPEITNLAPVGQPTIIEKMEVSAASEVSRSGNKLLLRTRAFAIANGGTASRSDSSAKFQLAHSYCVIDTIITHFNEEYSPASGLKDASTEYAFGNYSVKYAMPDKKTLVKTSTLIVHEGVYPAELFKDYRSLRTGAATASRDLVVLTK